MKCVDTAPACLRLCRGGGALGMLLCAAQLVIGGVYCLKGPGIRCVYQPIPLCSSDWLCSKTCTHDPSYGWGSCVDTGRSEDKCQDEITNVTVDKYLGRCDAVPGGNCECFPTVYKTWVSEASFSQDVSPCGAG